MDQWINGPMDRWILSQIIASNRRNHSLGHQHQQLYHKYSRGKIKEKNTRNCNMNDEMSEMRKQINKQTQKPLQIDRDIEIEIDREMKV